MSKLIFLCAAMLAVTTFNSHAQYLDNNAHRNAPAESACTLTDQKISALSFYMAEIGDLIEKCYYQSTKRDIGLLATKMNNTSLFCVDRNDPDTMLNHVLSNEFNSLQKITGKVTRSKVSQVSLSWFLEAKLQVLQMQALLLQGKTYFLITDAGKGVIQQISMNIRGIRDTVQYINNRLDSAFNNLNTYNQTFVQYRNSFDTTINIIKPAITKVNVIDNHLITIVNKIDSLNNITRLYIQKIDQLNYIEQLNTIKQEQQKALYLLNDVRTQVTSIQRHQKKTRLIAILSPLVVIAAIIAFK